MTLMLDPANQLRKFSDALYVGRACNEGNYFWYEDPMRDNGKSAFMHQKLRGMIKTPLLISEYVRGIEPTADFIIAGGTDFLRVDPEYDHGITGGLRIAHLGEAFGLDVEVHACGPAQRHLMSAMRNSKYYELALSLRLYKVQRHSIGLTDGAILEFVTVTYTAQIGRQIPHTAGIVLCIKRVAIDLRGEVELEAGGCGSLDHE